MCIFKEFLSDEDGMALTEYLILLGLLLGAVIGAILIYGSIVSGNWEAWANWVDGSLSTEEE